MTGAAFQDHWPSTFYMDTAALVGPSLLDAAFFSFWRAVRRSADHGREPKGRAGPMTPRLNLIGGDSLGAMGRMPGPFRLRSLLLPAIDGRSSTACRVSRRRQGQTRSPLLLPSRDSAHLSPTRRFAPVDCSCPGTRRRT